MKRFAILFILAASLLACTKESPYQIWNGDNTTGETATISALPSDAGQVLSALMKAGYTVYSTDNSSDSRTVLEFTDHPAVLIPGKSATACEYTKCYVLNSALSYFEAREDKIIVKASDGTYTEFKVRTDTPESMLAAASKAGYIIETVNHKNTSTDNTDSYYEVTFVSHPSIKLIKKTVKEGITSLQIAYSKVSSFNTDGETAVFEMVDGSILEFAYSNGFFFKCEGGDSLLFDTPTSTDTIRFTFPQTITDEVFYCIAEPNTDCVWATAKVDRNGGMVILTHNLSKTYEKLPVEAQFDITDVTIMVSNGKDKSFSRIVRTCYDPIAFRPDLKVEGEKNTYRIEVKNFKMDNDNTIMDSKYMYYPQTYGDIPLDSLGRLSATEGWNFEIDPESKDYFTKYTSADQTYLFIQWNTKELSGKTAKFTLNRKGSLKKLTAYIAFVGDGYDIEQGNFDPNWVDEKEMYLHLLQWRKEGKIGWEAIIAEYGQKYGYPEDW